MTVVKGCNCVLCGCAGHEKESMLSVVPVGTCVRRNIFHLFMLLALLTVTACTCKVKHLRGHIIIKCK